MRIAIMSETIGVFGLLLFTFINSPAEAVIPNKTVYESCNFLSWKLQTSSNASRGERSNELLNVLDIFGDLEMRISQEEARQSLQIPLKNIYIGLF